MAFSFIYDKLSNNGDIFFAKTLIGFNRDSETSIRAILVLILLSSTNWFFEIMKWKELVSAINPISFNQSYHQVLGSLTASIFTPNRIGEYGAKAVFFQKDQRKQVMFLNLIGNWIQLATTLFFGSVGLFFFLRNFNATLYNDQFSLALSLVILAIFTTIIFKWMLFKYFKIKYFIFKDRISNCSKTIYIKVALYSVIRYMIFSFQFYFILKLFDIQLGYLDSMILISATYFIVSIIPNIILLDVVVKGGVAVYLFSFLQVDEAIVLYTVTYMWILNFAIPSILGSFYVLNFKLKDSTVKS